LYVPHTDKILFTKFTFLFTIQNRPAEKHQSRFAKLIQIDMKNKRNVLSCLVIMFAGVIYFTVQAQQKNDTHSASFSGEWRAKESIAMGGNIVCCYNSGDRMLAKTMKITEQTDFLNVEVSSAFPGLALVASQEKLPLDGKLNKINYGGGRVKEFTVKLSADGKTITINSIVQQMVPASYNIKVQQQLIINITEVWKLSNDGRSITVQANAKSNQFSDKRSWKTVFDKVD